MAGALDWITGIGSAVAGFASPILSWFTNKNTNDTNRENVESANQANLQMTRETNQTNKQIADENLAYQRELQEYNKALQQQMFEREDTAYQRTASDMLNAGLNPLTMQGTNGSGEAISLSPLNNQYQAQQAPSAQAAQALAPDIATSLLTGVQNFVDSVQSIKTGSVQRDYINKQIQDIDFQRALKVFEANQQNDSKGIKFNSDGSMSIVDPKAYNRYLKSQESSQLLTTDEYEKYHRELQHQIETGKYDSDTKIEQAITALEDWLVNGRGEEAWNRLVEKYPFLKMFTAQAKSYWELTEEEQNEFSKETNEATENAVKSNPTTNRWTNKTVGNW